MRTVTVVVPTRDRPERLRRCLAALEPQANDVIVVDDGSSPAAVGAALRNRRSRGPAAARNQGWRASSAPFIAFTDDDCVPQTGWLAALVAAISTAPADVAGVGGRVLPLGDGVISRYMTLHGILEPPPNLSYLVTANCIFRRCALEAVGGFDEHLTAPGGEDPGLCFALRRAGYRFQLAPDAIVQHEYRESLRDFLKTFYRYGRGCRRVLDP